MVRATDTGRKEAREEMGRAQEKHDMARALEAPPGLDCSQGPMVLPSPGRSPFPRHLFSKCFAHSHTWNPPNKPSRWVLFYLHFPNEETEAQWDNEPAPGPTVSEQWSKFKPTPLAALGSRAQSKSSCSRPGITGRAVLRVPCSGSTDSVENYPNLWIMWTVAFYSPKHIK